MARDSTVTARPGVTGGPVHVLRGPAAIVLLAVTGACGGDRGAPPVDREVSWPAVERHAIHEAVLEHTRASASGRVCEAPCEIGSGDVAVAFGAILGPQEGPVVVETTVRGAHGTEPEGGGWGHRGTHHLRRRDGRWVVQAHRVQVMEEYVADDRFTP